MKKGVVLFNKLFFEKIKNLALILVVGFLNIEPNSLVNVFRRVS